MTRNPGKPYLHSGCQRQEGVAGIAHFENAAESVLCQISYFQNLQVGRHGAQVEFCHEDVIDDDRRLGRLVEGCRKKVACSFVEAGVGRQRGPVEVEGHVELALSLTRHGNRKIGC